MRHHLAPRNHAEHGDIHRQVERGDDDDGDDQRARDGAARVLHFPAQKAHVVVAPIVVGGDQHRRTHAHEECRRQGERAGGKVEGARGAEVRQPGNDDPADGQRHADPEQLRQLAEHGDAAIEQKDHDRRGRNGNPRCRHHQDADFQRAEVNGVRQDNALKAGPEISRIVRQADAARCDGQRRAERKLPDEEKRQQAAQRIGAVDFFQVAIRAAGVGHGRAQFGPDQPIAEREDRAENPAQHGLRTAGGGDDQRQRDERPHADHVDHVQRGGFGQADAADELGLRLGNIGEAHRKHGLDEMLASAL